MSIFNDKINKSVAEAAAKIMEQEASHPKTEKEKKLAAMGHPKDKITHKDVLIGRGVLKKEEAELDEGLGKMSRDMLAAASDRAAKGPKRLHPMYSAKVGGQELLAKHKKEGKVEYVPDMSKMKKEEAEQIDELSKDTLNSYVKKANASQKAAEQGKDAHHKIYGDGNKKEFMKHNAVSWKRAVGKGRAMGRGVDPFQEEAELDEADTYSIQNTKTKQTYHLSKYPINKNSEKYKKIKSAGGEHIHATIYKNGKPVTEETELDESSYSAKAARAGKDIGKPGKAFAKIASGAAKRYGSEERGKKVAGAVLAKLRMKEDEDLELTDEQVEELLEAFEYDEQNRMTFSEMIAAYKENGLKTIVSEEPTEEQFNKEIKDQTDSFTGKKKQPGVATPKTVGIKTMPEEVELTEEYEVKQSKTDPDVHHVYHKGKKIGHVYGNKKDMWGHEYHAMGTGDDGYSSKKEALSALKADHKHHISGAYKKDLAERALTEPETKKKEEVVKSMKKKLSGFKDRYGERAKSVMYATATRIAKEKA